MQSAYLLIMLFTLSYPLYKSFEDKVHYFSKWRYVIQATIPVALFFIVWDNWFSAIGIWHFNSDFVVGWFILHLPLEEYLFFFFVPFSCLFIHEVLYYFVKKDPLAPYSRLISWGLIGISLSFLLLFRDRTYPLVLFSLLIPILLAHLYLLKSPFMGRFYLSFAVSIIPFLIVNGLLTSLPVITYNPDEIMGIRLGSIPLEDLFYSFTMLLLITSLYERFKAASQDKSSR